MSMRASRCTAVIVNYNSADYLAARLDALAGSAQPPAEVIVVDNASTDNSLAILRDYPWVRLLVQPENRGFSGGANAGLAAVETEYALVMNPDVEVDPSFGEARQRIDLGRRQAG
jgi:hypothetical protein